MKYLVTGGAGFIGSHIVEKLIEMNVKVRVVDNLSTGDFANIQPFLGQIEFICGDLADYQVALKATDGIDYILHQAAIPSVPRSIDDPIATNNSMVTATLNLFCAAKENKSIKRIVQASSSAIYGSTRDLPIREETTPNPVSPYAVAKLAQENYGKVFYDAYGLEVISLRYFNVFGPRQNVLSLYAAAIPKFISQIVKNESPTIFGDGETTRDFVYIDNVVSANLLACHADWRGTAEAVNIGGNDRMSLNRLVENINKLLSKNIKPVYEGEKPGDIKHSFADINKANSLLGYNVEISTLDGLQRCIEWHIQKIRRSE